jgi:Raf kinase inhibitor-like YbhB/YbcL family protein
MLAAIVTAALTLSSPAFHSGARIPVRYTCEGKSVSPPLRWTAPPHGTRAFALLVVDPDAPGGVFTHWTLWNLPPTRRAVPAHFRWKLQGRNDGGSIGYTGPCPPPGPRHRYTFTLYALDRMLPLPRGASVTRVVTTISRHARATATLVGRYGR